MREIQHKPAQIITQPLAEDMEHFLDILGGLRSNDDWKEVHGLLSRAHQVLREEGQIARVAFYLTCMMEHVGRNYQRHYLNKLIDALDHAVAASK